MAEGSGYKEYVAGLPAGVSMVIVGHPFDTVKVKLQKHNTEGNEMKYKSSLHCTTRILQTEGVKGLYRGATSSFLGMTFESSLAFEIYSQMKQFLQGDCEILQCRMQVQGTDSSLSSIRYSGPIDCALKTVQTEGLTGMFRGGGTTLLRESNGNAVFFSTYEYVRYHMHQPMRHTSSAIYKRSGFKGCYTGLGHTIVRAFPANAAAIVTWEIAVKLLGIKRE